jgi:hypothetical protein
MERTWTQIGKQHNTGSARGHLEALISKMQWTPAAEHRQEGMMPAMGISEAIKQLRLPKVTDYAITGSDIPCFGLYGIRCHYKNGMAQVYVMDLGSELIPVASDFWPKTEEVAA